MTIRYFAAAVLALALTLPWAFPVRAHTTHVHTAHIKAAPPAAPQWIPTWYASPEAAGKVDKPLADTTLRQIVRVSAGGTAVRIRLSNAYGTQPLTIDDARIARRASGSAIDPASDANATFGGHTGVTIAPGAYVLSDPIPLSVAADSDLAISLYVSAPTPLITVHDIDTGVLYAAPGNQTSAVSLPGTPADIGLGSAFPWLAEVEVSGSPATGTVIAFGDSITDGYGITADSGGTWPDVLSLRLHAAGLPLSVINAGLSGNRLLHNGQWIRFGDDALARFDRDVLAQPNAQAVIVMISINDLGHAAGPGSPEYVSAGDIIDGLSQLAARAHEHGLRVYAGTLTPFKGTIFAGYYSDEKEARRQSINAWLRTTPVFDGVVDFDQTVLDPAAPLQMQAGFDHGDHLHPNNAGAAAMANAIPLSWFDGSAPARAGSQAPSPAL